MKITFDTRGDSYIEFNKNDHGKISIVLSAKDSNNHLNTIINSVEITNEQLILLLESIGLSLK